MNLHGPALGSSERTNHSPCCLRRLDGRLQFLGGARQASCGGRKEGLQGRKGSVIPLRCVNVGLESALKTAYLAV